MWVLTLGTLARDPWLGNFRLGCFVGHFCLGQFACGVLFRAGLRLGTFAWSVHLGSSWESVNEYVIRLIMASIDSSHSRLINCINRRN